MVLLFVIARNNRTDIVHILYMQYTQHKYGKEHAPLRCESICARVCDPDIYTSYAHNITIVLALLCTTYSISFIYSIQFAYYVCVFAYMLHIYTHNTHIALFCTSAPVIMAFSGIILLNVNRPYNTPVLIVLKASRWASAGKSIQTQIRIIHRPVGWLVLSGWRLISNVYASPSELPHQPPLPPLPPPNHPNLIHTIICIVSEPKQMHRHKYTYYTTNDNENSATRLLTVYRHDIVFGIVCVVRCCVRRWVYGVNCCWVFFCMRSTPPNHLTRKLPRWTQTALATRTNYWYRECSYIHKHQRRKLSVRVVWFLRFLFRPETRGLEERHSVCLCVYPSGLLVCGRAAFCVDVPQSRVLLSLFE